MSDLIDRQAAIDAIVAWTVEDRPDVEMPTDLIDRIKALPTAQPELNEWCHDCKEYDKEHHCCPRWNRVIRTTLEEAQQVRTEMSSANWISCSERLPDMHDEVLVTARGEVSIAWLYADGKWRSNDMPQPMFRDIIAWMPLPAPYKEDKV